MWNSITLKNMKNKIYSNIKLLLVAIVVITASITYVTFAQVGEAESLQDDGILRAAIIDQLYDEIKNENFHDDAIGYLENAGYVVDVYTTTDITVDFFKKLPQMNYDFVVMRTHGVADFANENSMLFTGEKYSEENYITEQLLGTVKKGTPLAEISYKPSDDSEWIKINETTKMMKSQITLEDRTKNEYFVITPKFVKEAMQGKFYDTTFILGGCDTLSSQTLAKSLIERGASSVVGWDNRVSNFDNDYHILLLLRMILEENMEVADAVDSLDKIKDLNSMAYPASLEYYSNTQI